MRLQFKHQKFQADAAKAVVDVFVGQPYLTPTYMIDMGANYQHNFLVNEDFTGWGNQRIVPKLTDAAILAHVQKIQRSNQIEPSAKLEGKYNLTIEMETGVGKTYTYIKTMYELNKHYGWSKFIIVVPSIAVREGVCKSFSMTQEHFAEEYGKKIRLFIYNSSQLAEFKDGYIVKFIDGRDDSVEFVNGIKIYAGDVIGRVSEEQLRRLQIRETILSHIERERQLFHMGIKKQGSVPQCRASESS